MADEINASPDATAESIEKPHYHEVSGTLQVFLGLFTLIFVMILGKCSIFNWIPTRPIATYIAVYFTVFAREWINLRLYAYCTMTFIRIV